MTYKGRHFQVDFDFISHLLIIQTSEGSIKTIALRPRSVADFYQQTMATMNSLGLPVTIWTTPSEVPDRTPFENDEKHAAYDPKYVHRFWRILVETSRVFTDFRSQFTGKVSPVHLLTALLIRRTTFPRTQHSCIFQSSLSCNAYFFSISTSMRRTSI